jgi:MFS family permease
VFSAVAILAFGTGLVTPCLRSLVSRRLEGSGQGAALGSLQGLQSAGSFLGPPLAGLAYETLGHQSPFWLSIALMVAVAALVAGGTRREAVPTQDNSPVIASFRLPPTRVSAKHHDRVH